MLRRWVALCSASLLLCGGCADDEVYPPAYGAFMGVVVFGEVAGRLSWGPAQGGEVDPFGQAAWLRQFIVGPDLQPDFIDQGIPPFCMAFQWPADGAPNINAADAGKLEISGYDATEQFVWGVNPPPEPTPMPGAIECQRGPVPGTNAAQFAYGCNVEPMVGVTNTVLTEQSRLAITASGGANVGAFAEGDIRAPSTLEPADDSFDLNQLDLQGEVRASWKAGNADFVMVELFAQLIDAATPEQPPSRFGQVLCLEPAASMQKQVPTGALAVLPKPSGSQALIIQSVLVGVALRQAREGWGSYMVGAGRGVLGITCRTAAGELCPPPGPVE